MLVDSSHQYPRHASRAVRDALADTPVVVIQGARQVGKSTLATMLARGAEDVISVTLDDPATLAIAEADPVFFVEQAGRGLLVIDEAQRAPGLILPLKATVDRDRRPGRFLLTGSADLLQVKGVGDSLAGRAETIELMTLSQGELARREVPEDFVTWVVGGVEGRRFDALDPHAVVAGGYPEAIQRSPARAARWFSSYVDRLADHDARELQSGGYADHMRTLLSLVAAGGQSELVKARLARGMGVSENSVDAYVRLASTMRLLSLIPSWGRSSRGRIARRPKVGLSDAGLGSHLAGFTSAKAQTLGGREYYGALVEQFCALELARQRTWSAESWELFHFRDHDGLEVEIVIELADGRLIAVEVKSAEGVTEKAWRQLERFRARFSDRDITGVVLHGGTQVAHLGGWLHVLPITSLWQA